jgi:sulfate transport system permease protein
VSCPGYRLSLGITLFYLALIVLLPIGALLFKAASLGPEDYWRIVTSAPGAGELSRHVIAAGIATLFNLFFGLALAWVLVRYEFPGKRLSMRLSTCRLRCPRRLPALR